MFAIVDWRAAPERNDEVESKGTGVDDSFVVGGAATGAATGAVVVAGAATGAAGAAAAAGVWA